MKLILVRHGESARNRGYEVKNEENNLTTKGVEQAIEVAKKLADIKIDVIYCSSSPRCEQTLNEIIRNREDDIAIHFSKLLGPKLKKEKYEKLKARVNLFLDDLKYDHRENETILVVSHMLPIRMMLFLLDGKERIVENGELFQIIL